MRTPRKKSIQWNEWLPVGNNFKEGENAVAFEVRQPLNDSNFLRTLGKAGRSRWLNARPTVRGVAMNPIDHPHGGGEGKKSGKNLTPWGKPN